MQEQAIKEKVKERYNKIALAGTCDSSTVISAFEIVKNIGYDTNESDAVPESSIMVVVVRSSGRRPVRN